ncbi:MAG TPA: phospholipase C, phosphocholine-specific [Lacipirellulaceae bacterium]|jgi:phospholipase C|nr:phospholipase C, phosphocholine-specific [Lacipirellulaceae bacterium]
METRRGFLAKLACLSGSAAVSTELFGAIERAMAIEPSTNSTFLDAEHVVILMQENRSFDHTFGMLRGVRGFNDRRAITLQNGLPVWVQTNAVGESYAPFRLNLKDSKSTWMGSLPHGRTSQVDARNNGLHDRWLDVKRSGEKQYAEMPLTLGYHTREDIPFYYALADAFTVCDQNFCSSLTGTTPNRCYLWTGTIRAQQSANSPANVVNEDADHATNVGWPTFPERLEDLGASWVVYQNEISVGVGLTEEEDAWLSNFGDNPLEYFRQFNVRLTDAYREYVRNSATDAGAGDHGWNDAAYERLSARQKSLIAKAFCSNRKDPDYRRLSEFVYHEGNKERRVRVPKGDLLHQFRSDVTNGTLPMVSWIVPPERFSDHPGSPWYGSWYVAEVLDIMTKNPEVWKKTIFILTYDENDGYFDHVPPFVAPDPRRRETGRVSANIDAGLEYVYRKDELNRKPADECRDSAIGLGYRVPMIIASPWSRGGYVCSQVFDHTSPLQFLERLLSKKLGADLRETNISAWRRAVCGDLTSAFRPQPQVGIALPKSTTRNEYVRLIHEARFKELPTGYHKLSAAEIKQLQNGGSDTEFVPRQEAGTRPSCALPYELSSNGKLSDDRKAFLISFEARTSQFGDRAAGAPFLVYARLAKGKLQQRAYAVSAGDRLEDFWPITEFQNGAYELSVYGPNGFFRNFIGQSSEPQLETTCDYAPHNANRQQPQAIAIHVANRDPSKAFKVELIDNAYGTSAQDRILAPQQYVTIVCDVTKSSGWYDLSLRVADNETYSFTFAGHVEVGASSISDPAMA